MSTGFLSSDTTPPARYKIVLAFAAVYLIWGSTYLAIYWALESLPPFMMAGSRFVVAGGVLLGWTWLRTPHARPTMRHWRSAMLLGCFLVVGGNGALALAQQHVPSGLAALASALTPCLMVLMQWRLREGHPSFTTWLGVGFGLAGMVVLIGPGNLGSNRVPVVAAALLVASCVSWAVGSLYGRRAELPDSVVLTTGMQMLCGGTVLCLISILRREHQAFDGLTLGSALAQIYLIVFGSLIGYSAYVWLMKKTTPAKLSTHAYVNPVVAVTLGWLLGGEVVSARVLIAASLSLSGVLFIVVADQLQHRPPRSIPGPGPSASGLKRWRSLGGPRSRAPKPAAKSETNAASLKQSG